MDLSNYKAKINPKKKKIVQEIKNLADNYSIIGIVDIEGLPALQFQRIRASLNKTAKILIVKKNLINLVFKELEKTHKGILDLTKNMDGIIGLIFTNDNPFTMYKFVKKSKSTAPAKEGSIAPKEIVVPAGPTNFAPGPIIGELGALKIKAGINEGKVEIKEDAIVAKEGEEISKQLASVLSRLGVEPMEVGLNIKAIYEDGIIYDRKTLDVDENAIIEDIKTQASNCFALSIGLNYFTKENINHFISKAGINALSLSIGIEYPNSDNIKNLILKSSSQMIGLVNNLPEDNRPAGLVVENKNQNTPVTEEEKPSANEEPKKEEQEEDASASLGSFF